MASSSSSYHGPRGMAERLRRVREERFGRLQPPTSTATYRRLANPFAQEEARLGDTCASFCRPLPAVQCCFMDLRSLVNLLLFLQFLYGVTLVVVHSLLLLPPFNEPEVEAFPAVNKWLPLFDLQFGFRIDGGDSPMWEEDFIDIRDAVEIEESNYLGTVMGLVVGVITVLFCLAVVVRRQCCAVTGTGYRTLEKSWLVFTTGLLGWFCLCNLGKVPTGALCYDALEGNHTEIVKDADTVFHRTEGIVEDSTTGTGEIESELRGSAKLSPSCDVYRVFFVQWTLMATILGGLLLWAAMSSINKSIVIPHDRASDQDNIEENGDDEE
mmetsp:Transcript_68966/g.165499  ORF Transcript_68966/g.165499 Transcript_68966/m.165499 type:complete len:326 (+) Transcript_68966:93-1070(+)